MQFTPEMMLHSDSGYCMPYEEKEKDVEMCLGYGKQKNPKTGELFFHHGIDLKVQHYLLSALATGKVSGIGNDAAYGLYLIIRYEEYYVTYSHLNHIYVNYGQTVKAGQIVAMSSYILHLEVRYKEEELNPLEFLTMLYGNIKSLEQNGSEADSPQFITIDMNVHNMYEKDQKEIEDLMIQFLPDYMNDINSGLYSVPEHTEMALRNVFTISAMKNYFYETLPSMANPLGMGARSIPIAEKVQNILIGDFLNYMAIRHQVFLSTLSALEKKKAEERANSTSGMIDPLEELEIDMQSFDIPRVVSVYPDRSGIRWWTKAWFNNNEVGESAIEIDRQLAIRFINDLIEKDDWLEEYFPKQMEVYHHAIEQTKEKILSQLNI